MNRLSRALQRGNVHRDTTLDEGSTGWREKAARKDGPDTYVAGDLCRSIFRTALRLSAREREEEYGGPVVLVGVLQSNITNVAPSNMYCTVVPVSADGHEISEEKVLTRTIMNTVSPVWDEVHAIGLRVLSKGSFTTCPTIRIKVKHFESKFKSVKLGQIDLPVESLRLKADATLGQAMDEWFDYTQPPPSHHMLPLGLGGDGRISMRLSGAMHVGAATARSIGADAKHMLNAGASKLGSWASKMSRSMRNATSGAPAAEADSEEASMVSGVGPAGVTSPSKAPAAATPELEAQPAVFVPAVGRLRLGLLLHTPPPDPQPIAVHVRALEARSLMPRDPVSAEPPYLKVKVMAKAGEHCKNAVDGKDAEARTGWVDYTTAPVWKEAVHVMDKERGATEAGLKILESMVANAVRPGPADPPDAVAEPGTLAPMTEAPVRCDLVNARHLLFVLKGHAGSFAVDTDYGEAVVSFSSLIGDEAAVLSERSLRVCKWFKLRPHKSMPKALEGKLGEVKLDITLVFENPLLPPGWQEAVDLETGASVYYNVATGARQTDEPEELASWRSRASTLYSGPEGAGRRSSVTMLAADIDAVLAGMAALPVISEAGEGGDQEEGSAGGSSSDAPAPAPVEEAAPAAAAAEPAPAPAPAKKKASGEEDDEDEDDVTEEALAKAQETLARMDVYGSSGSSAKMSQVVSAVLNPLAAADGPAPVDAGERERYFFEQMRKTAEARKKETQAAKEAKLAAMNDEEKKEFAVEMEREERRDARKARMLQAQLGAFGSSRRSVAMSTRGAGGVGGAAGGTGRRGSIRINGSGGSASASASGSDPTVSSWA